MTAARHRGGHAYGVCRQARGVVGDHFDEQLSGIPNPGHFHVQALVPLFDGLSNGPARL